MKFLNRFNPFGSIEESEREDKPNEKEDELDDALIL
jgi:hypothetical protein